MGKEKISLSEDYKFFSHFIINFTFELVFD